MNMMLRALILIGGIVVAVDSCRDRSEFAAVEPPAPVIVAGIQRLVERAVTVRSALSHTQPAVGAFGGAGLERGQAGRAGRLRSLWIDDDAVGGVHRSALFGVEPVEPVVLE